VIRKFGEVPALAFSAASFSICFAFGIRQEAGRSFMLGLEQKQNIYASRIRLTAKGEPKG